MTTLVHLSDLHFGREDPALVEPLLEAVAKAAPHLIVVSGDLTQRAKKRQFRAAREFLKGLPEVPQIVVPGNHDVSTTNLFERIVHPLKRYRRFITANLQPFHSDEQLAVAGINTVRLMSTKDGRINRAQVEGTCERFANAIPGAIRVVVTHHPMDLPAEDLVHPTLTRARMAMQAFSRCGVDLFLSGHLHAGITLATCARYQFGDFSAVVAHAGTAISTRTRGEPNGWNLIHLEPDRMEIVSMQWNGKKFAANRTAGFIKGAVGWQRSST